MTRRYTDIETLEALWADIDQRCSELVDDAAQDIADEAVALAQDAADDSIREAIEAVGDISELAVPLMTADVRGGAKLGDGLHVEDGALVSGMYYTTEESDGDTVLVLVYDIEGQEQ